MMLMFLPWSWDLDTDHIVWSLTKMTMTCTIHTCWDTWCWQVVVLPHTGATRAQTDTWPQTRVWWRSGQDTPPLLSGLVTFLFRCCSSPARNKIRDAHIVRNLPFKVLGNSPKLSSRRIFCRKSLRLRNSVAFCFKRRSVICPIYNYIQNFFLSSFRTYRLGPIVSSLLRLQVNTTNRTQCRLGSPS